MTAKPQRYTIYMDPDLHKALKLKAAETSRAVSDLVSEAVREILEDNNTDDFDSLELEERVSEPQAYYGYDDMGRRMVTVSQNWGVSLPADLCKQAGLKKGDKLIVEEKEGSLILKPVPKHPLLHLKGKYKDQEKKKLTELLYEERQRDREREQ